MKAKECIDPMQCDKEENLRTISAETPLFNVLHLLLETPQRKLRCISDDGSDGVIDEHSLLEAFAREIAVRDDSSMIVVECRAQDYSASSLAHAVEDADAHLVDLLSTPSSDGRIRVMLRVRHSDPSAAERSLERYGYDVVWSHGSAGNILDGIAAERLLSLRTLLSV